MPEPIDRELGGALGSGAATVSGAERRPLTIMFVDVVDSTGLSERMDAEALREMMQRVHSLCASIIEGHGGYVAQYLGDGVLAYFGYPRASETDATNCVHAAVEIARAVAKRHRDGAQRMPSGVHIGVHSGTVVVGLVGAGRRRECLALGRAPNVAARLSARAAPHTVLLSDDTRRLLKSTFDLEALGPQSLRGLTNPVDVFELSTTIDRMPRRTKRGPSKRQCFVGRERELDTIAHVWSSVVSGQATRVVHIVGDAGTGKTRLAEQAVAQLSGLMRAAMWLAGEPEWTDSPLHPLRRFFFDHFGLPANATEDAHEMLSQTSIVGDHVAAWIEFLWPRAATSAANRAPGERRRAVECALTQWCHTTARESPLVIVVDDRQWMDASTWAWLEHLATATASAPILLLTLGRRSDACFARDTVTLELGPLTASEIETLVEARLGGRPISPDVARLLYRQSDGVPLYAEAIVDAMVAGDDGSDRVAAFLSARLEASDSLSESLRVLLSARIDALGCDKFVLQICAVLGREFAVELLDGVVADRVESFEVDDLAAAITRLVATGMLERVGVADGRLRFEHALGQAVCYQGLLARDRRRLHAAAADMLREHFSDEFADCPEALARHLTGAERVDEAIEWWERAARLAMSRAAFVEANAHFERALSLAREIDNDGARRDELELRLLLGRAQPLMAVRGFASDAVQDNYKQALTLCFDASHAARQSRFSALTGLWRYDVSAGNHESAAGLAQRLAELADTASDELIADHAIGVTAYYRGELGIALQRLRSCARRFASGDGASANLRSLEVSCQAYLVEASWEVGDTARALEHAAFAMALARRDDNPYDVALALAATSILDLRTSDIARAKAHAQALIDLASRYDLAIPKAGGHLMHGHARFAEGKQGAGADEMRRGLADWERTGARTRLTDGYARWAEVALVMGELAEARAALRRARELEHECGERFAGCRLALVDAMVAFADDGNQPAYAEALDRARELAVQLGAEAMRARIESVGSRPANRVGRRALLTS